MLNVDSLSFAYPGGPQILRNVSLELAKGEALCLAGPNGSGKSTLLGVITGSHKARSGSVTFDGEPLNTWKSRRHLAYVPQASPFDIALRVEEVISLVRAYRGWQKADEDRVIDALALRPYLAKQLVELSGGYRRRVLVGLALMARPRLIVLDEPLVGIDIEAKRVLLKMLDAFRADGGSILWTSHDLSELLTIEARISVLLSGRIVFSGTPQAMIAEAGSVGEAGAVLDNAYVRLLEQRRQGETACEEGEDV